MLSSVLAYLAYISHYLYALVFLANKQMVFSQRVVNVLLKVLYDVIIPSFVAMNAPFQHLRVRYGLNATLSLDDAFKRASLRYTLVHRVYVTLGIVHIFTKY